MRTCVWQHDGNPQNFPSRNLTKMNFLCNGSGTRRNLQAHMQDSDDWAGSRLCDPKPKLLRPKSLNRQTPAQCICGLASPPAPLGFTPPWGCAHGAAAPTAAAAAPLPVAWAQMGAGMGNAGMGKHRPQPPGKARNGFSEGVLRKGAAGPSVSLYWA